MKKVTLLFLCILLSACANKADKPGVAIQTARGYGECKLCDKNIKADIGLPLAESKDTDEFIKLSKQYDTQANRETA